MFRKRKHDKLQKAVESIKNILQDSPKYVGYFWLFFAKSSVSFRKATVLPQVKYESLFSDIYDSLTSPE